MDRQDIGQRIAGFKGGVGSVSARDTLVKWMGFTCSKVSLSDDSLEKFHVPSVYNILSLLSISSLRRGWKTLFFVVKLDTVRMTM